MTAKLDWTYGRMRGPEERSLGVVKLSKKGANRKRSHQQNPTIASPAIETSGRLVRCIGATTSGAMHQLLCRSMTAISRLAIKCGISGPKTSRYFVVDMPTSVHNLITVTWASQKRRWAGRIRRRFGAVSMSRRGAPLRVRCCLGIAVWATITGWKDGPS